MGWTSVKRLEIQLDRENGAHMPGELVSGKVLAEFTKPKKIVGLKVMIVGEALVKWSAQSEEPNADGHYQNVVNSSHENYFSSKFYLLGSNSGPEIELPPGLFTYPFSIQLPMNLPSSFEHEYGYVRYTIKAIFDRPWKFDHEVKRAFTVLSTYDLNRKPEASLAIREKMDKSFCCFCICPSGSLEADLSVPSSGYVPGQTIPVTVECENNSDVRIEKIKVQLKQKLQFHATTPRWTNKEESHIVAEEKRMNPFTNDHENRVMIALKVPPLPSSNLEYCGIIDLDYYVRVVICFSGMHCSLERRFPVLIGTIPLYNSFSTFNTTATVPSPSAPLLTQAASASVPFLGMPQPSSTSQRQAPQLGFVMTQPPGPMHGDPYNLPPPSYEECMKGARSIRDKDESEYVMGARVPFAPRYPVYNYNPSNVGFPAPPPTCDKQ